MRKTLILTFILLSNSCFASNFLTGSIYESNLGRGPSVHLKDLFLLRRRKMRKLKLPD